MAAIVTLVVTWHLVGERHAYGQCYATGEPHRGHQVAFDEKMENVRLGFRRQTGRYAHDSQTGCYVPGDYRAGADARSRAETQVLQHLCARPRERRHPSSESLSRAEGLAIPMASPSNLFLNQPLQLAGEATCPDHNQSAFHHITPRFIGAPPTSSSTHVAARMPSQSAQGV